MVLKKKKTHTKKKKKKDMIIHTAVGLLNVKTLTNVIRPLKCYNFLPQL